MTAQPPPQPQARGPLRALVTARVAERFADELAVLGIPLVATVTLAASPLWIGTIKAGLFLAPLLISLPAGLWADRFSPRRIMATAALVRGLALAAIAGVWALGWLTERWLLALAVAAGLAATTYVVVAQAAVPAMMPQGALGAANARIETGAHVSSTVAPTLGGVLGRFAAAPLLPLAAAASTVVTGFAALKLPEPRRHVHAAPPRIRDGLAYVVSHPLQRRILARSAVANLGMMAIVAMMPVAVIRTMGFDALALGVLLGVSGVGGIAGAAASPALTRRFGEGGVVVAASVVGGAAALLYPVSLALPRGWNIGVLLLAETVSLAAVTVYSVTGRTLRQQLCPPDMQGRMNASMSFAVQGTGPVGAVLGGALASAAGTPAAFWAGALLILASVPLVLLSPLRGMREVPVER
ncbi:MFS transporter [Demequina zhanjiangensis]|uniref:MFS transporter n=1 Tax=Demequina zhanjiangensis TaxID=3051659 RepID=A0ABT8G1M9_9MICO|nr:MFS transporter [Demequina sp. SYSU T00b26]MDN4472977.1 MFS transporter [Demequina sp. SYSU T00b26]